MLLIAFVIGLCGCGRSQGNGKAGDEAGGVPSVTVSIPPLEYFAKAIGGDSLNVSTLLPAGSDPETFDPGMGKLRELNRSGVLIVSGMLPFERSVITNLRSNSRRLSVYEMAGGIDFIYGTHTHDHRHDHYECDAEEDGSDEPDPHIWTSVRNARKIAGNMLKALCEVFPGRADYYRNRHDVFVSRLDSLDSAFQGRLAALPSRSFLIWHPSLSYLARDYDLQQIAFNVENKETSSLQLQEALARANAGKPLAFFVPEGMNPRRFAAIAEATGVEPVCVNLMSSDWDADMRKILSALSPETKSTK